MKIEKRMIFYGFLVWLIPFLVSFLIWPIHESNRPLFESVMPVVLTASVVFFSKQYFKNVKKEFCRVGIQLGLFWLLISLGIDLIMFSGGPMKMSLLAYIYDIGLTYLIIPIVTTGFACLLVKQS